MEHNVFEYLNLSAEEKLDFFLNTRSTLKFLPKYWINFDNVRKNINLYDNPDLYTLDYLIGRTDEELKDFFYSRPELLKLTPKLLGIRDARMKKGVLEVEDIEGDYELNFREIEESKLDLYIEFIYKSGLVWIFKKGVQKSIHDYAVGVEAGMDSNGRKNRSGDRGELYLEELLNSIAESREWLVYGQTTGKTVDELYEINLGDKFSNRRFDGSLFDPERQKLYLFEINNYSSSGSKIKSTATEFKDLHNRLSRTNHEFIYVTDGVGWDNNKSQLLAALNYIGKVFNYKMIENGYLEELL